MAHKTTVFISQKMIKPNAKHLRSLQSNMLLWPQISSNTSNSTHTVLTAQKKREVCD